MAKYIHTGKINPSKTILSFAGGALLAVLIGWTYGFLMELNPFIIVDLLIIAIFMALLMATSAGMSKAGSIRNKGVKFVLALVVSFTAWYTAWAYLVNNHFFADLVNFGDTFSHITRYLNRSELSFGKMTSSSSIEIEGAGMWILAIIEALLFMLPIVFVFTMSKDYFCETCQKFNLHQKSYIHAPHDAAMLDSAEYTGNFKALSHFPRVEKVPDLSGSLMAIDNVYEMDLSYCRSCKRNGVININRGNYKIDNKTKKVDFESKEKVIRDVLVDDATLTMFRDPYKEGTEDPF
jgi:hypothetical protein